MGYTEVTKNEDGTIKRKRKSLVTHHIQFSPGDEEKVKAKAAKAGLPVSTYIKNRALNARVQAAPASTIDLSPVLNHTLKIGEVVDEIRKIAIAPHEDRWLYEKDLEQIQLLLTKLNRSESELAELIRSQIGR